MVSNYDLILAPYFDFEISDKFLRDYSALYKDDSGLTKISIKNSNNGYSFKFHPVKFAQQWLNFWGYGVEYKSKKHKSLLSTALAYLRRVTNKQTGIVEYGFPFNAGTYRVRLNPPWGSAMAQGQWLSILARLQALNLKQSHKVDTRIMVWAHRLIKPLEKTFSQKGLAISLCQNDMCSPFFLEYPVYPYPLTLNGFMFTLIGLFEYSVVDPTSSAASLFKSGVFTLKRILHLYDENNLSTYDLSHKTYENLKPNIKERYHKVHIRQLYKIFEITNDNYFLCVTKLWNTKVVEYYKEQNRVNDFFNFDISTMKIGQCKSYLKGVHLFSESQLLNNINK